MPADNLAQTAKKLVAPTKGILAADWSLGTSEKHFTKNNIEHTEESRRKYRQMLFATPGLEDFISGVIFFEETIRQKTDDDKPFPKFLSEKGIIPGIKVDKGAKDMANFPEEKITEGLDGLRDRLKEYAELGARFTKWRAVFKIGDRIPSTQCIRSNAEAMARYASLSQEAGLVPVVEPEVLIDGTHPIARDERVTKDVLTHTFSALVKHKIDIKGVILKTNFIHPGKESGAKIDHKLIAEETLQTLERTLPPALPGAFFLSGGDSSQEATEHLNWVNKKKLEDKQDFPWELTFSYARALQYPAIEIWAGKSENVKKAQKALIKRAKLNSLARQGKYNPEMEKAE